MTNVSERLTKAFQEMREEFDKSFSLPVRTGGPAKESLVMVRLGGELLAVRTMHVTGLARTTSITAIPTHVHSLLGITTIRGALLPVYDLAELLGFAAAAEGSWLLQVSSETPIAFIFDGLENRVEIERSAFYQGDSVGTRRHLRMMAKIGDIDRAVIDIPGLVAEIRERAGFVSAERSNSK